MLAFAVIALIGLAILVTSLTFGELLDTFDLADTGLSSTAVGASLAGMGSIGVLTTLTGMPVWAAITTAVLLGLIGGYAVQHLIDRLQATDTPTATYDVIGTTGVVTATTNEVSGEVRLDDRREVESRLATASTILQPGTRIRVTAQAGSRVHVEAVSTTPP